MEEDTGAAFHAESINDDEKNSSSPSIKRHSVHSAAVRGIGFNATLLVARITTHGRGK